MRRQLYLGTNPPSSPNIVHHPVISPTLRSFFPLKFFKQLSKYTHIIFTSRYGVHFFFHILSEHAIAFPNRIIPIVIGKKTAEVFKKHSATSPLIAPFASQEGVIELLRFFDLSDAYCFIPCSSQARNALSRFLISRGVRHHICHLYDPLINEIERVDLSLIDEIIFTSPSTVIAFLSLYTEFPQGKILTPIGPITAAALKEHRRFSPCK